MTDTTTITLTMDEFMALETCIALATRHGEESAERWEKLAAETLPDGAPKFEHAASNAQYWRNLNKRLDEILKKMREAG